jgi:SAM-dependent methyltransferase
VTAQANRWQNPALLGHLARVRRPWDGLTRRVVRAVLAKFLPTPPGPLVEIGAGGGQLRDWLPPEVAADTTHTEPSEPFLAALRSRFPDAKAVRADATALPFPSGSTSAVLGLCVLDTLPDLASVRDELRRVLRPGGVVVHFLDLATCPDAVFPELIAGGEIPLTNFARDPALLAVLPDEKRALLPPADDFDDILAVRWDAFTGLAGMLAKANHAIAAELGPYRTLHEPGNLDPDRLTQEFMAVSADPERLLALNKALLALTLTARSFRREWPVRAVSSREYLREKLRRVFATEHGFAVEFAGPVSAWEAATGGEFVLRHAGRTATRPHPMPIPGTPAEELEGVPPAAAGEGPTRATTVEAFVARRGAE